MGSPQESETKIASSIHRGARGVGYIAAALFSVALGAVLLILGWPIWLALIAIPLTLRRNRHFDTYLQVTLRELVVRVGGHERASLPWDSIAAFRVIQLPRDPPGAPRGRRVSRAGTPAWVVVADLRDGTEVELLPVVCEVAEIKRVRPQANVAAQQEAEAFALQLERLRVEFAADGDRGLGAPRAPMRDERPAS